LDFAFDFEDKQGRISRRRYVYGRARGLGHRSNEVSTNRQIIMRAGLSRGIVNL
jgi:hypothetical protein